MQSDIKNQADSFFKVKEITDTLPNFVEASIIFGAILVFFYLIVSGIGYINSGGDKAKVDEAQKRITTSIIGLALLSLSWVIFKVIVAFLALDTAITF